MFEMQLTTVVIILEVSVSVIKRVEVLEKVSVKIEADWVLTTTTICVLVTTKTLPKCQNPSLIP